MIPRDDVDDDCFAELLAAADEALAAGETPHAPAVTPDLGGRLQRGLACVQLLRDRRGISKRNDPAENRAGEFGQIGRFQLRRELGRGGFGVVLLAYDPRLQRDVALKVPRADVLFTPELRERFQREARAAAGLDHPNIVPVYDAGEIGPVCYIASSYCPGVTLAEWLRQRTEPVPFADAAELVARLADAVQHAHSRGILHRDLKPANILLSPDRDDAGRLPSSELRAPKITDFGLARVLEGADGAAPPDPTRTGVALGTPSYMAPEQAEGKLDRLGPATDVYALGAILYELLTGRPPFRCESELDTILQVRSADPVPPPRLRPKTSRDLETICLKCLAKESIKRYATAEALAADLRSYLAGGRIVARPVAGLERASRWCRRRPLVASLLGALALVVAVALGTTTHLWLRAERARADEARRRQLARLWLDRMSSDAMELWFARQAGPLAPAQRQFLRDSLAAYEEFAADTGNEPDVAAGVAAAYGRIAQIRHKLGDSSEARAAYETAIQRYRPLVDRFPDNGDYRKELARAYVNLGNLLSKVDPVQARATFLEAQRLQEHLVADFPGQPVYREVLARSRHNLGVHYRDLGRWAEAIEVYQQAIPAQEKLAADYPHVASYRADLGMYCNSLAVAFTETHRPSEAEPIYRRAILLLEPIVNQAPADLEVRKTFAMCLSNLGTLLGGRKNHAEAEVVHRRSLLLKEQLAADFPGIPAHREDVAASCNNLGLTLSSLGREPEAEAFLRRGLGIREALVSSFPSVPGYASGLGGIYCNLGQLEQRRQKWPAALAHFDKAVAILTPVVETAHLAGANLFLRNAYLGRVETLDRLRRHAEADQDMAQAFALCSREIEVLSLRHRRIRGLTNARFLDLATAEASEIVSDKGLTADVLFDLAIVYAAAANVTKNDDVRKEAHCDQAIQLLHRADAAGALVHEERIQRLRNSQIFDSLRNRPDFQHFLKVRKPQPPK